MIRLRQGFDGRVHSSAAPLPARVDMDMLRRKADPACAHCPNGGGRASRPAVNVHPRGPAWPAVPAVNCPVLEFAGRWGWPCHRTLAEAGEGEG